MNLIRAPAFLLPLLLLLSSVPPAAALPGGSSIAAYCEDPTYYWSETSCITVNVSTNTWECRGEQSCTLILDYDIVFPVNPLYVSCVELEAAFTWDDWTLGSERFENCAGRQFPVPIISGSLCVVGPECGYYAGEGSEFGVAQMQFRVQTRDGCWEQLTWEHWILFKRDLEGVPVPGGTASPSAAGEIRWKNEGTPCDEGEDQPRGIWNLDVLPG